ncbi:MAG: hypothetical protein QNL62_15310 [Gammaproteobacteria bacterium]|nr:hypothetical protein [Gammaproteobacteria bacterium]
MFIEILEKYGPHGDKLVASFGASKIIVGRAGNKPLNKNGLDDLIREKFNKIARIRFTIDCE